MGRKKNRIRLVRKKLCETCQVPVIKVDYCSAFCALISFNNQEKEKLIEKYGQEKAEQSEYFQLLTNQNVAYKQFAEEVNRGKE